MALEREANRLIRDYLNTLYGITEDDVTTLIRRYINADTIRDAAVSFRELKVAAAVERR